MKKHKIHQSDQEQLASASQGTLSAVGKSIQKTGEVVKAVKDLQSSIDNKSDMIGGFTGVLKSLKKTNDALEGLRECVDNPEQVIRKLEEIKSAGLIANKLLKEISQQREVVFPEIPKADFTDTNKLLGDLLLAIKEDSEVTVTLSIE